MSENLPDEIVIDVRGLQPPEPLERVMDALDTLGPQQRLRMLIDREPVPLYRILERNGHPYFPQRRDDGLVEILILPAA